MYRKFITAVFVSIITWSCPLVSGADLQHDYGVLEEKTQRYISFMNTVGQPDSPFPDQELEALFVGTTIKELMGEIIAGQEISLKDQLLKAKEWAGGSWSIRMRDTLIDPIKRKTNLYFTFTAPNLTQHMTMANLYFSQDVPIEDARIIAIPEVCGPVSEAALKVMS